MRIWLRWVVVAAAVMALVVAAVSWRLASVLVSPANHPVSLPGDFASATISIPGKSHLIAGTWRDLGGESPVVLLLHGFRGNRASTIPRARLLIDAGFSVLMIDQQAHGETPGDHITLGWLESADVRSARAWIASRAPGRRVGVIGVSLGGASVLLGPQPAGFDAVVLEAVYPRLGRAIENRIRMRVGPLEALISPLLILQIEPRLHVSAEELAPIRHIHRLGAPVLVVGGSNDQHTTEDETRELFAAAAAPKEIWIVEGAEHVDFSRFDHAAYDEHVIAFLRRHLSTP
jgi:fermentation-respiration switch protein FrsA (DUF1100 family)